MNQQLYLRAAALLLLALVLGGCQEGFWKRSDDVTVVTIEERELDTLWVEAPAKQRAEAYPREVYRASTPRAFDLLHTRLAVRFDWAAQAVQGEATLVLKPYFYTESVLQLDAKGFDIHGVMRIDGQDSVELNYENTGEKLNIGLGKPFSAADTVTIYVAYTARPADRKTGGSAAIRSDQGLYFINHDGSKANVPQQIWTQGETESSSCWFPTIDKPNERTTQEIYITVEERFKTLSNGVLVRSQPADEAGLRTDYWRMEQPHAPYLFMLAVGEFAVVRDQWEDVPLAYWVEPEYEADAAAIFAHTSEMLSFFSDKLGLKYPWPKYDQVVVREFVSGAMENTTGVIFGDFVQRHKRELIDDNNDLIVAHEMFHHWFGDYVTCESWSNLALNESFANYSEYLWVEHKYGADAAGYHLHNELEGYLYTPKRNMHDLIHFKYDDKEDMFDRHSYNKGGCILHYLRYLIGDEAFFKSLNLYLTENAYTTVEAHQLRLAVEEVTGLDWNWFFNQWFFSTGHPELVVTTAFDSTTQMLALTVEQIQDPKAYRPVFDLPLSVDVYLPDGSVQRHLVRIQDRVQTFQLPTLVDPALVILDPDHVLVGGIATQHTLHQSAFKYRHAPHVMDRYDALMALLQAQNAAIEALRDSIIHEALRDPYHGIRELALRGIARDMGRLTEATPLLNDPNAQVQTAAWLLFAASKDSLHCSLAQKRLGTYGTRAAYTVVAAQLQYLSLFCPEEAIVAARPHRSEPHPTIVNALADIYASTGDTTHLAYFLDHLPVIAQWDGEDVDFLQQYERLLSQLSPRALLPHARALQSVALTAPEMWTRYRAARLLRDLKGEAQKDKPTQAAIQSLLAAVIEAETAAELHTIYESWQR